MTTADPLDSRDDRMGGTRSGTEASREPLIVNPHRKLPVWQWVIPLVIIVAVIALLPHILEHFI